MADTLDELAPDQWTEPSLCGDWSVQVTAGHILVGAEQTTGGFAGGLVANGFRFNRMMDRSARRAGALPATEIIERLRATSETTNGPPAPVMTMLGEVVVHGEDIRRPLGVRSAVGADAVGACLEMYQDASFPVGTKKRIAGLRLIATDVDWSHGSGPEVHGTALSLLLAMTGRPGGLDDLDGEGLTALRTRMVPTGRT
jgi:uncharacterized protein (TIGR03083 family)